MGHLPDSRLCRPEVRESSSDEALEAKGCPRETACADLSFFQQYNKSLPTSSDVCDYIPL